MSEPSNSGQSGSRDERDGYWPGIPIVGLAVVAVGLIFLGRNFGVDLPLPDRWWALFILVPAGASLVAAARWYRVDGRLSSRVVGPTTVGALMLATALILFFDLEWSHYWPLMVIIVGLGIIARGSRRSRR